MMGQPSNGDSYVPTFREALLDIICKREVRTPPCHGFQFGCRCPVCKERAENPKPAPRAPSQPWDMAA